ncbi:MAG: sigma-54 dependent transcriptional regulator [Planctomycetota bacterium]|nr:sigma-54 dependent transcriptional regulator [Planctomycetota bacterium]MDA0934069.1 sigma-54 dependent transcriptional regulator [Planctomycetota bacterium]
MTTRVHLLLRDPPLQRRIRRLCTGLDVTLSADAGRGSAGDAARAFGADLFVVRDSLLVGPDVGLADLLETLPDLPDLVVVTRGTAADTEAPWIERGALRVIGDRDDDLTVRAALTAAVAARQARSEHSRATTEADPLGLTGLQSKSPAMRALMRTVQKVAGASSTLLIEGETGAGKEVLARAIHRESPRRHGPFVAVNCTALPDTLIESELFGHEAGAFTDAQRQKRGKFELAHGGTIFLDEIGSMPIHLQSKMLRVLQDRQLQRLGGETSIGLDVRVIAATNANLEEMVRAQTFRADLYYRLAVVLLRVPPLRERREDIADLARHYVDQFARPLGRPGLTLSSAAVERLENHDWPGNVRELVNAIERAVLLCDGDQIEAIDFAQVGPALPPAPSPEEDKAEARLDAPVLDLRELCAQPWVEARDQLLARFGGVYVRELLRRHAGRVGDAARSMGVNPRSLYDQMKKLGIDKREFRVGGGDAPST